MVKTQLGQARDDASVVVVAVVTHDKEWTRGGAIVKDRETIPVGFRAPTTE